jgi:chemotaxis protein CheX
MTKEEILSYIKIITDYFESITGSSANLGMPFMKESTTGVFDFTSLIGISGTRKGAIYFTAERELLQLFGSHILGDEELDDESLYDLAGEMTNTISGNMREFFGSSFLISVPIIIRGNIEDIQMKLKPPVFVIPIEWQGLKSHLAIGLE